MDLALNNLQRLVCHKTKWSLTKPFNCVKKTLMLVKECFLQNVFTKHIHFQYICTKRIWY